MNKIEVRNLQFSYGENEEILKGINLDFDSRSTAIIGQNGAGKTTFVKLLKGLLKPTSGDVIINGINTKKSTVAGLAKYIGLVFQNPNDQIFKNKVMEEVIFGPLNIGQTPKKAKENSIKALKSVGLYEKIDENPYDLSLSERKLISIASILAMDTEIIIFDEPTIAQDYYGKEKIKSIIKDLSAKGTLVLAITHDMDFVSETFEAVVVFAKGNILLDGSTREIYSHKEELEHASLEAPNVTQLCQRLGVKETFLTVEEFIDYKKN
ncbi:MAG: energy-coupling factor ABC transporter ATP-binding protein [Clostridium sp.]|uniref:energy-coupling factor ABC transporter ATP-binding protein n=1 Tax=Clostridium sp. TaxID=1506 RepID=UPI003D6D7024